MGAVVFVEYLVCIVDLWRILKTWNFQDEYGSRDGRVDEGG